MPQFSANAIKRIRAVVKRVEATPTRPIGGSNPANPYFAGMALVKTTATPAISGRAYCYEAILIRQATKADATGDLAMSDLKSADTEDTTANVIIYNMPEMQGYGAALTGSTYYDVFPIGRNDDGKVLVRFIGGGGGGTRRATITGHAAISGHVGWTYAATLDDSTTVTLYNDMEPCEGTPGKLGLNVAGDGTLNGGSCHIQPIGNATVPVCWDAVNERWAFCVSNGAQ